MYSKLQQSEKLSFIQLLHAMRDKLSSDNLHIKNKKRKTKKTKMTFKNKEMEELFNKMSPECRKLLL